MSEAFEEPQQPTTVKEHATLSLRKNRVEIDRLGHLIAEATGKLALAQAQRDAHLNAGNQADVLSIQFDLNQLTKALEARQRVHTELTARLDPDDGDDDSGDDDQGESEVVSTVGDRQHVSDTRSERFAGRMRVQVHDGLLIPD